MAPRPLLDQPTGELKNPKTNTGFKDLNVPPKPKTLGNLNCFRVNLLHTMRFFFINARFFLSVHCKLPSRVASRFVRLVSGSPRPSAPSALSASDSSTFLCPATLAAPCANEQTVCQLCTWTEYTLDLARKVNLLSSTVGLTVRSRNILSLRCVTPTVRSHSPSRKDTVIVS